MSFFRRSFLLSVSFTFLLGYAVLDIGHFVFSNLAFYEEFQRDRMIGVINLAGLGKVLLQHEETLYLEKRLRESMSLHDIDFYFIKRDGQVISFETRIPLEILTDTISDRLPGQKSLTGDMPHIAFRHGPYQLAIGLTPSRADYLRMIFEKNRVSLIFDIMLVVLMATAIAFFFFKDIRTLIEALKSPGKRKLQGLNPAIAEANLMLQGIKTYETRVNQLQTKQGILSRNLSSALRTELDSGRTPPYQFRCTMVRTDINQYSTIYSEHVSKERVETLMAVINEFFSKASQIIARYNGYVTDFVGDEIIYYFKDDDHVNSAAIAAAAIRDIHEVASEIHLKTSVQDEYAFTVKSAMACGSLRFGPHVNGFSLSGGAFVETVRILSQVDEKSENSVYLPARLASRIQDIGETEVKKTVALKGLPGVTELHRVSQFYKLNETLSLPDRSGLDQVNYFRSPQAVRHMLEFASKSPRDLAMPILKSLSLVFRPFGESDVLHSYLSMVENIEARIDIDSVLLSYSITLSRTLISSELYQDPLKNFLKRCLRSTDRRTVANAVEALIHFEPNQQSENLARLLKHPDNRVVANTLIKIGMLDMGREVVSGLVILLQSSDARFVASGAYAVGVLISYHRTVNPLFAETHDGFRLLIQKVAALSHHPDPMVRRQSSIALEKTTPARQAA